MAGRWLQALRDREKISQTPSSRTDKTDRTSKNGVSSVLSVPPPSVFDFSRGSSDHERAAILEVDGGLSRDYADAFAELQNHRPDGVTEERWRLAIDDAGRFLDQWGEKASAFGWSASDLFDHVERGAHGLLWELDGRNVIALTIDGAALGENATTLWAWFARPLEAAR